MKKYIFVTGGVVSSLGKGITASAIGALIKAGKYSVNMMKIDPYLNVDAGTMRPYEHGEVFVCKDGTETDLDLGNYERFLQIQTAQDSAITTGKIYQKVIESERRGEYLGQTVQVIPHITDEIKRRIRMFDKNNSDICIIELGGTIGDIESIPFVESLRQFSLEELPENVMFIHLTLVPTVGKELKTKPSQHSVKTLMSMGIHPDMLVCRSQEFISDDIKEKISLFCNVRKEAVISLPDVELSIYEIPILLQQEKVLELIEQRLKLPLKKADLSNWHNIIKHIKDSKDTISIAFIGKYLKLADSYKSTLEAFYHAGWKNKVRIEFININPEDLENHYEENIQLLEQADGIFIPGGFGGRGINGKIKALEYGRINNKPTFGICIGLQCMVIEYARNVLNLNADSTEFDIDTPHPVIDMLSNLKNIKEMGGTMRLGAYQAFIEPNSKLAEIYGQLTIEERHRHRFEVNPHYTKQLEDTGLKISAVGPSNLVEALEIPNHPWYIAVQYHPEFLSSPLNAHPLFDSFVKKIKDIKENK
ncbi:MAG: CTP synthase [Brevinemataceae bacterium]